MKTNRKKGIGEPGGVSIFRRTFKMTLGIVSGIVASFIVIILIIWGGYLGFSALKNINRTVSTDIANLNYGNLELENTEIKTDPSQKKHFVASFVNHSNAYVNEIAIKINLLNTKPNNNQDCENKAVDTISLNVVVGTKPGETKTIDEIINTELPSYSYICSIATAI